MPWLVQKHLNLIVHTHYSGYVLTWYCTICTLLYRFVVIQYVIKLRICITYWNVCTYAGYNVSESTVYNVSASLGNNNCMLKKYYH